MISAREIFMGFCRYYNSLNLEFRESVATHSHRIFSYFDTLGRMLGYSIVTENKMKSFAELRFSIPSRVERYENRYALVLLE